MIDRAIADYDTVLRLDPTLADIFNARGELWRKKGDRPQARWPISAPRSSSTRIIRPRKANYKSLAQELERLGALMAVDNKPSFNCATARRPVEKAICANPELANLDREINAVNARVVREATATARAPAARCSASRTSSSPAATPRSAGRTTICRRRCASGCERICSAVAAGMLKPAVRP